MGRNELTVRGRWGPCSAVSWRLVVDLQDIPIDDGEWRQHMSFRCHAELERMGWWTLSVGVGVNARDNHSLSV